MTGQTVAARTDLGFVAGAGSLATGICVVVAVLIGAAAVVSAHSNLLASSPGPGAVVGGSIITITLQYENEVVEFRGRITRPDGSDVESSFEIVNATRVVITLAARLDEPGEYAVRHATRSRDTDLVEAAFLFTFDPEAPPPELLQVASADETPWSIWAIGAIGTAVIALLGWRLIGSIRQRSLPT